MLKVAAQQRFHLCCENRASSRLEGILTSRYARGASSALGISQCLRAAELCRNRQLADLLAHILTDLCREAVMKPGIDTRIGNFVAVILEPAPFARDARRGGAGQRKFPELVTDDVPENRRDRSGNVCNVRKDTLDASEYRRAATMILRATSPHSA